LLAVAESPFLIEMGQAHPSASQFLIEQNRTEVWRTAASFGHRRDAEVASTDAAKHGPVRAEVKSTAVLINRMSLALGGHIDRRWKQWFGGRPTSSIMQEKNSRKFHQPTTRC
jgi:hypothetical protein